MTLKTTIWPEAKIKLTYVDGTIGIQTVFIVIAVNDPLKSFAPYLDRFTIKPEWIGEYACDPTSPVCVDTCQGGAYCIPDQKPPCMCSGGIQ